jgi:hypothetical protein
MLATAGRQRPKMAIKTIAVRNCMRLESRGYAEEPAGMRSSLTVYATLA